MEMYERPGNRFVAEFVGSPPMNIVPVSEEPAGLAGSLLRYVEKRAVGTPGCVGLRPEALKLARAADDVPDTAWSEEAVVETVLPTGASWTVQLRVLDTEMFAVTHEDPEAGPGDRLRCWARPKRLHLFGEDGARIGAWDDATAPVQKAAS
jgi:iron(III) transport system ATP-binding protein